MDTNQDPNRLLSLFFSRIPSIKYVFRNGKEAIFIQGQFATDVPHEIEELTEEVKHHHPHIYTDTQMRQIQAKFLDPHEVLKEKIIAEYLAKQAAATNPQNDAGTSDQSFKVRGVSGSHSGASHPIPGTPPAIPAKLMAAKVTATSPAPLPGTLTPEQTQAPAVVTDAQIEKIIKTGSST